MQAELLVHIYDPEQLSPAYVAPARCQRCKKQPPTVLVEHEDVHADTSVWTWMCGDCTDIEVMAASLGGAA